MTGARAFPFDLVEGEAHARDKEELMNNVISQKEVNRIASFVEACCELEKEPFFGKDEKLKFRGAGNRWTFTFGDRFHFRSALISFRRLWMKDEPSNWEDTINTLKRPEFPEGIGSFAERCEHNIRKVLDRDAHPLKLAMPSHRIIDLWLNTVFAHGGLKGRNKRSEFESTVDQYGHAFFEFTFRSLVREIGREFIKVGDSAAKPALDFCSKNLGMSPSFRMGAAFGTKRRETTKEGHVVVREGSSEYFSEETMEERFKRILERREHEEVNFVFKNLDVSVSELLLFTLRHASLAGVLESFGGRLEVRSLELHKSDPRKALRASWTINHSNVDVLDDCVVVTDGKGAESLNVAVSKFRKHLLED